MQGVLEIRWHGRGGQGAKTAAILLGEALAAAGKHIQAFPEYGPERMGAPVLAFNRVSDKPIRLHCHVEKPRIVVILDPTLVGKVDVTGGVPEDGIYVVNTNLAPAEIRQKFNIKGGRIFTVDATQIALDTIGRDIPNTPMMGALLRSADLLSLDDFIADTRRKLEKKFKSRPEIIDGNIRAIQRAYQEVRSE